MNNKKSGKLKFIAVLSIMMGVTSGCTWNSLKNKLIPESGPVVNELWHAQIGEGTGNIYSKLLPAVTEKFLYASDTLGNVVALHRDTGKTLWVIHLNTTVSGGVFAGYGLVLIGTSDGELIALDQETGTEKWRIELSSEILAPPQFNGKWVIAQTADGSLYAVDGKTGVQKWVYSTTVPVLSLRGSSTPLIIAQRVIAGFANGKLLSVLLENGIPEWETAVAVPQGRSELERIVDIDGRYVAENNSVFVSAYQGKTSAIELNSGRTLWQRDISSYAGLGLGLSNVYVTSSAGMIIALDQRDGTQLWEQDFLQDKKPTAPVIVGSYLIVSDFEGNVYWLSQVDGSIAAHYRMKGRADRENPTTKSKALYTPVIRESGNGIRTPPVVKDEVLYLINNQGELKALTLTP